MTRFDTSKLRRLGGKILIALIAIVGSLTSARTYAETIIWNNFNGTNGWQTPGNWLPAAVPASGVDLVMQFASQSVNYTSTNSFGGPGVWTLNQFVFDGAGIALTTINNPNIPLAFSTNSSGSAPSIVQNSAGNFTILGNGGINLLNNLYLRGSGSGLVTLRSIISGSNGLIFDGSANYALTTVRNTYSGGTTINAGTLRLSNLGSVVTGGVIQSGLLGTGSVNFNGGAITASSSAATAFLPNAVNIGESSIVAFGDSDTAYNGAVMFSGAVAIGQNATVLVRSNLALSSSAGPTLQSNVIFEIANAAKLTVEKLDVTNNVTLSLVLGTPSLAITYALTGSAGDLNFTLNGSVSGGVYTLLTFASTDLSYSNLHLVGGAYALDTTFGQDGWLIDGTSIQVKVVPEPSTWAMALLGLGVLVLVGRRSRLKVLS